MGHKGDRVLLKNSCNLVKLVLLAASWGDRLKPVISQVSCNLMFLYGPTWLLVVALSAAKSPHQSLTQRAFDLNLLK